MQGFVKYARELDHFANFRDMVKEYLLPLTQFKGITNFHLFQIWAVHKEVDDVKVLSYDLTHTSLSQLRTRYWTVTFSQISSKNNHVQENSKSNQT